MVSTTAITHAQASKLAEYGSLGNATLGTDLRALRKAHALTLTELAMRIGRSVGYLSQIERGLSEPSIGDLRKLAAVYDIPLGFFFANDDAPEHERGHVVRQSARRTIGTRDDGLIEELLSPDLGGSFELVHSTFAAGTALAETIRRETEEAGFVVSGTLDLEIGGVWMTLNPGDSFRFAAEPYRWRNTNKADAVVIWVIAPPIY